MKTIPRGITGLFLLACAAFSAPAQAAIFNVDTFADSNAPAQQACTAAPNDCSLRGAILAGNALPGLDTVRLPAGVYALTIAGGDNVGALGDLDITDDLNLVGLGLGARIDAAAIPSERVVEIPAGFSPVVELRKLALSGGTNAGLGVNGGDVTARLCIFESNSNSSDPGGGIDNTAILTLRNSFVRNNSAGSLGGGIHNASTGRLILANTLVSVNTTTASGGGLANFGTAILNSSTVRDNIASSATSTGGGIENRGFMRVLNSDITGNLSNGGGGVPLGVGGIMNDGPNANLVVRGGAIEGNSAPFGVGGGLLNNNGTAQFRVVNTRVADNDAQTGAGIYTAGDAVIRGSEISSNAAAADGGGLFGGGNNTAISAIDSTFDGNSAAGNGGAMYLGEGQFSVSRTTLSGNSAQGFGGGIYHLDNAQKLKIDNSVISGNSATSANSEGGGIFNYTSDILLDHVLVRDNFAGLDGGGIKHTDGAMTVLASAIVDNEAGNNGGGVGQDYNGRNTTSSYTNVTISGNLAAVDGGGIYNSQSGGVSDVFLFNATIAANDALGSPSDGVFLLGGVLTARNSIIGKQVTPGADCQLALGAVVNAPGNNMEELASCGFSIGGLALGLDVLADNGGFTPTHALLAFSPALNAGNALGCGGDNDGDGAPDFVQATDQRDSPRGAPCDLGAYEL